MAGATDTLTEVTAEQWAVILPDLEKMLKTKQKAGEELPAYALRLAKAASDPKKVGDDDWETLDEVTQQWINGATVADEKGEPLALPPGMAAAPDTAAQEDVGRGAADATKPARTPAKKDAKESKAAAAKAPVKGVKGKVPAAEKAPAKSTGAKAARGRPSKYGDKDVISLTTKENPHRKGSKDFDRFRKLKEGQSVGKARASGVEIAYLRYLVERRGLIKISPAA